MVSRVAAAFVLRACGRAVGYIGNHKGEEKEAVQ